MNLSTIRAPRKAAEKRKRVGRGMGSGMGKTSTRGHKGQWSRSGARLLRRIPKRGFKNIFREEYAVVNLDRLDAVGETEITPEVLRKAGVVRTKKPIKILGNGELKSALTVKAHKFSKTAEEKITKAGGKFEVLK